MNAYRTNPQENAMHHVKISGTTRGATVQIDGTEHSHNVTDWKIVGIGHGYLTITLAAIVRWPYTTDGADLIVANEATERVDAHGTSKRYLLHITNPVIELDMRAV